MPRKKFYFKIPLTKLASDLGVSGVIDTSWDGANVVFRQSDIETSNSPVAGVTRVQERYVLKKFNDLYTQYFSTIPRPRFRRVGITFDNPKVNIIVNLNLEE